jgi:ABC-type dipeptide/oligopeptide/nickel transport system permease component
MAERSRKIRHARVVARLAGSFAAILLLGGLLAATLVRLAPGFGTDERMLNPQLSTSSIQALTRARAEQSNVAAYYLRYLRGLFHGELGMSMSLGRSVKELLRERAAVSVRSAGAGLGLAWLGALAAVLLLEMLRYRWLDRAASSAVGALLCVPAALVAVGCFYFGGAPALAIAAILFPRIYRYLRSVTRQAGAAPHVLAAQAFGEGRLRVLGLHVLAPILPELLALAGISVSMAIGATIPVEALCDAPGVGQLVWQAALARDLPVIVNVTLLITALTAAANLAADAGRAVREARI